jgi:hypothetical protein
VEPKQIDSFGPAIGRGAVWQEERVARGDISDAYLLDGYDSRTLYFLGDIEFDLEIDVKGDGVIGM